MRDAADTRSATIRRMGEHSDDDLRTSMIRLEAKIDVVLSQHDGKISDLTRRQGETDSTIREHDSRITANALTTTETRALVTATKADVQTLRADTARDITEIKTLVADQRRGVPTWIGVGVAAIAIVIGPILAALLQR